jgi:hypothetical protein
MPITQRQIILVHKAKQHLGLEDAQYRTVLRNAAGVETSKDLTQQAFEDVMAVLEDSGFQDPSDPERWRRKVEQRGSRPTARQLFLIRQVAPQQRYTLEALCQRFSAGRTDRPERLTPREAWKLIEMLKAAAAREANGPPPPKTPAPTPAESTPSLFPAPAPDGSGAAAVAHHEPAPRRGAKGVARAAHPAAGRPAGRTRRAGELQEMLGPISTEPEPF